MLFETLPLAERLRPKTIEDFIGQQHLVGKGQVLHNLIESGKIFSMIFWGPPGVGKLRWQIFLLMLPNFPSFRSALFRPE